MRTAAGCPATSRWCSPTPGWNGPRRWTSSTPAPPPGTSRFAWVEYDWDAPHRTRLVDYRTASRHGEAYAALIERKGFVPNPTLRYCTGFLKRDRIEAYARHRLGPEALAFGGRPARRRAAGSGACGRWTADRAPAPMRRCRSPTPGSPSATCWPGGEGSPSTSACPATPATATAVSSRGAASSCTSSARTRRSPTGGSNRRRGSRTAPAPTAGPARAQTVPGRRDLRRDQGRRAREARPLRRDPRGRRRRRVRLHLHRLTGPVPPSRVQPPGGERGAGSRAARTGAAGAVSRTPLPSIPTHHRGRFA